MGRRWRGSTAVALALPLLVLAACGGGAPPPGDGSGDPPTASAGAAGDEDRAPDGWREVSFPGGSVAVPTDWTDEAPFGGDDVFVLGPDVDGLPGHGLRVRVSDRDEVPFEELTGLFAASLALQASGFEAIGEQEREVVGAEQSVQASFHYDEDIDGESFPSEERTVVAWFGGDRQLQVRAGGTIELLERDGDVLDDVLDTLALDG